MRDAFARRADEEGYRLCPAPAIELADPPSFGRFDPDSNTVLQAASWSRLAPEQRQRFESLAAHTGGRRSAPAMFEEGTYGWVFVHELAHWWQSCRQATRPRSYGAEAGANRIALAFWRERDPLSRTDARDLPLPAGGDARAPVPAGMPKPQYLDDHFLAIAQGRSYTWYQADMTLELAAEAPPTFVSQGALAAALPVVAARQPACGRVHQLRNKSNRCQHVGLRTLYYR